MIGQHRVDWFRVGVRVLPTAVQTQTQRSSLERPPLPPEGLNTGEVLSQREGGGKRRGGKGGIVALMGLGVRLPGGLPSRV